MSERSLRSRLVKKLAHLHAIPVENGMVHPGTPDFNCILGWIELKWLHRWPRMPNTPVRIEHFTKQQRDWLDKRWAHDYSSWLLLQVGREYLLFTGRDATDYVGKLTRNGLYKVARHHWKNGINYEELEICLRNSGG